MNDTPQLRSAALGRNAGLLGVADLPDRNNSPGRRDHEPFRFRAICGAAAFLALFSGAALADVTVLGWPGGPEEVALRKAAEVYNAESEVSDKDKVELDLLQSRGLFPTSSRRTCAAGSTDFDVDLLATYAIGRYAPFMDPVALPASAKEVFDDKVLATMQYQGEQYGVPTDLSLHFMYYRKGLIDRLLSDEAWKKTYSDIAKNKLGKALEPKDPDKSNGTTMRRQRSFYEKHNPEARRATVRCFR